MGRPFREPVETICVIKQQNFFADISNSRDKVDEVFLADAFQKTCISWQVGYHDLLQHHFSSVANVMPRPNFMCPMLIAVVRFLRKA